MIWNDCIVRGVMSRARAPFVLTKPMGVSSIKTFLHPFAKILTIFIQSFSNWFIGLFFNCDFLGLFFNIIFFIVCTKGRIRGCFSLLYLGLIALMGTLIVIGRHLETLGLMQIDRYRAKKPLVCNPLRLGFPIRVKLRNRFSGIKCSF